MLKRPIILVLFLFLAFFTGNAFAGWSGQGCTTKGCHSGIEPIMPEDSEMMKQLKHNGLMHGDQDGCVMCHGGNPAETKDKKKAHMGVPQTLKIAPGPKEFYPDPASIWVTRYTCAVCHTGYDYRLERAPMNTEAGKISGNLHTWGFEEVANHKVPYGNYDVKDLDGPTPFVGTPGYKEYMNKLIKAYSYIFPSELKELPSATPEDVVKDPKKAGLIYQRQECQRCHVGIRGREKRGDYRGMGCAACHIPYSNEGFYEGNDESINKKEHGHMLAHRIQGTRYTKGIPVETCNSCHNRGKRIGVSYQGLMEFPYGSPFNEKGKKQPKLHTKKYLFIGDDLHHQYNSRKGNPKGGLLCQDCHTSIEMHGDGNIHGTTLAAVEIECADCHGSVDKYPWELPLGYQDESGLEIGNKPRGLAKKRIAPEDQFGYQYKPEDGFLLSARGNPLGNVVKRGNKVIVHSATGLDFEAPVLKTIDKENSWKNQEGKVAMKAVKKHMDKMECYACHSSWVPQCYGCHVKVDLSNGKTNIDWVASGNTPDRYKNGLTTDAPLGVGGTKSAGKAMETRSYLRWEDPVLGYNGENRITPLMPGCQVTYTVIGPDGKTLINNQVEYSMDEAKERGQKDPVLAIDMAPVQPHTSQRKARSCESCHSNPKTVGLGIGGGLFGKYNENVVEDLIDAKTFKPIPKQYQVQIPAIPRLGFDWSQIVTRDGKQLATVGTHWPLSRPFTKKEIDVITRTGTCMGCHQNMSEEELWKKVSTDGQLDVKQHLESMNQIMQYLGNKGIKPAKLKKK